MKKWPIEVPQEQTPANPMETPLSIIAINKKLKMKALKQRKIIALLKQKVKKTDANFEEDEES